jgi:hypothetical protein
MTPPDLLEQFQTQISARLAELQPLVAEYERLQSADQILGNLNGAKSPTAPASPVTRRRRRSARTATGRKKPVASMPREQRMEQLMTLLRAEPNIKSPAVAAKFGTSPGYTKQLLAAARARLREEQSA